MSLIDVFAKWGLDKVDKALFEKTSDKDVIRKSWAAHTEVVELINNNLLIYTKLIIFIRDNIVHQKKT